MNWCAIATVNTSMHWPELPWYRGMSTVMTNIEEYSKDLNVATIYKGVPITSAWSLKMGTKSHSTEVVWNSAIRISQAHVAGMFDWRSLWRKKSKPSTALSSGSLTFLSCFADRWIVEICLRNVFQFALGSLRHLVYLNIVDRRWAPEEYAKQHAAHLWTFGGSGRLLYIPLLPQNLSKWMVMVAHWTNPNPGLTVSRDTTTPKDLLPCGPVGLWNRFACSLSRSLSLSLSLYNSLYNYITLYIHAWLQKGNSVIRLTPNAGQPWECGW